MIKLQKTHACDYNMLNENRQKETVTNCNINTHRGEKHGKEIDGGLNVVASVKCYDNGRDEEKVTEGEEQSCGQLPRVRLRSGSIRTAPSLPTFQRQTHKKNTINYYYFMASFWCVCVFVYLLCTHMRHRGSCVCVVVCTLHTAHSHQCMHSHSLTHSLWLMHSCSQHWEDNTGAKVILRRCFKVIMTLN